MTKKRTEDKAEQPDFEAAIKELEALVEQLESGQLGLADSLSHFEKGVQLSRQCHALIDRARQTVELLSDVDDESSARTLPLSQTDPRPDADEQTPF